MPKLTPSYVDAVLKPRSLAEKIIGVRDRILDHDFRFRVRRSLAKKLRGSYASSQDLNGYGKWRLVSKSPWKMFVRDFKWVIKL